MSADATGEYVDLVSSAERVYPSMVSDLRAAEFDRRKTLELRVLYVAATRAQSRVVAWWAPIAKNVIVRPQPSSPATGNPPKS